MEDCEKIKANDYEVISRKSWTAYIGTAIFSGTFVLVVAPAVWGLSTTFSVIFASFGIAYGVFIFLGLRSHRLYIDDTGVWEYSGFLPWAKGATGVKWRDLDSASYTTGFTSWLFKSYTIHISHRYTKSSELVLTHMALGHDAAMAINKRHQALVSQAET